MQPGTVQGRPHAPQGISGCTSSPYTAQRLDGFWHTEPLRPLLVRRLFTVCERVALEESKEVIPMMEAMITQIEEQQNIMAEMLQEIQEKDEKLMCFQEQEERLQQLEKELSELLQILPDTEELLMLLEEKTDQIQKLTDENQQWQELAQKLNSENRLLQKQNSELLNLNSN